MSLDKPNAFGPARWREWVAQIGGRFAVDGIALDLQTVDTALQTILSAWPRDLPKGVIHGDLFPDNVFFDAGDVCGVIDFHFVCTDFFAYDLAVSINAWCFDRDNHFVQERYDNMLRAYESVRPLSVHEKEALPLLLQGVALRFFLSRAEELLAYTPDLKMKTKDPLAFWQRLQFFQNFAQQKEGLLHAAH
jgi:homoserine kinase type II